MTKRKVSPGTGKSARRQQLPPKKQAAGPRRKLPPSPPKSNRPAAGQPSHKRLPAFLRPIEPFILRISSRVPNLGPTGTVIGLAGLIIGTVAIAIAAAVFARAVVVSDVLNPIQEAEAVAFTPIATPNPEFLAPTFDMGNDRAWKGQDRVTVLLLGTDGRAYETGYRTRTDTIILLMMDPKTSQASMLSIPRDLYVEIPGRGLERINTAYVYGGAQLAVDTVEYNFGVYINYYAIVDFQAFITLVDEIGGIDVYVPRTINDPTYPDEYYGYDPFYIAAGQQHLDGRTALKYARTRHADNDYERARRQQAVIMAIRDKVIRFDMLPTLIERAPALSTILTDSVRSDLTLEEMTALALLAEEVPEENIRTGVIDSNYITGYRTSTGADVSIPIRDKISELFRYVFWLE